MTEAEGSVAASADKANAVGFTTKSLEKKLAELQVKAMDGVAILSKKVGSEVFNKNVGPCCSSFIVPDGATG